MNFLSCTKYFISIAYSSFCPSDNYLVFKKKLKEKQVLWARHTAMWFGGKSQAGAWADVHTGGLAAGTGRAGHLLGRQPAQSGQRQDRPLQEETGTRHLSSKRWQSLPPRTAGRAGQPGRCVCLEQIWWCSVLLSAWGGVVPAPTVAALPQRSGRSRTVSSLGLVLSLLSRRSGLLPGRRGFLFKIQYFQGLVTANRQELLSWVSTLNFDCAAEHLWTSSEPVFRGTHMHPCTYATPINRKNTQYKHIHTQSHMDTCSLIETRPMYWISLLASKSWPICQYLRDASLDHFHCLSLKSWKLFCWPLALAPIFFEK